MDDKTIHEILASTTIKDALYWFKSAWNDRLAINYITIAVTTINVYDITQTSCNIRLIRWLFAKHLAPRLLIQPFT